MKPYEIILNSLNLKLISPLESSQWNEEFELDSENIKIALPRVNSGEKLNNWCRESLEEKLKGDEDLITKVKKWCVIGTIEEKLSRKKNKAFILDSDDSGWENIYNTNTGEEDRAAIGLDRVKNDSQNKSSDQKAIKDFCAKEKAKKFLAKNKTTSIAKVEKWCMKTTP